MNRLGKIISGLVLLVSLALVLSYCGGTSSDSSSGGSSGTASAGAGASASSSAIRSATMALSATAATSSNAPSFRKAKNLGEAVNGFYSALRVKRAAASALRAKFASSAGASGAPQVSQCTNGGTMTTDTVRTSTDITVTITYSSCAENYGVTGMGIVQEVQNGAAVFILSGNAFTISLGSSAAPYTDTVTRLADQTVVQENVMSLTLTGTLDASTLQCGTTQTTDYSKYTLDMDGNVHSAGLDNNVAYDETAVFSAYKLVVAASALDNNCDATGGSIAESGTVSYTDNLDSIGSESISIPASTPLSLAWTSVTTGDQYAISGSVSMVTPCFTGSLTLETTTYIFYPTNTNCPTAGVIVVSGDVNGTVVYTATGGVDIQDGAGTVVESYPSCNEAQACQ
jgi:hypothetical protein